MASFPEEEDEFLSEEVLGRGWAPLERRHLKAFRIHALIGLVAGRQRMFFFCKRAPHQGDALVGARRPS